MTTKRITQREAQSLRHRVPVLEQREDEGNCWINWDDLRALIDRAGGGV